MVPLDTLNAFRASSYGVKSAAPNGTIGLSYSLRRTHLILVCKEHAGLEVFSTPVILRGEDNTKIAKPSCLAAARKIAGDTSHCCRRFSFLRKNKIAAP